MATPSARNDAFPSTLAITFNSRTVGIARPTSLAQLHERIARNFPSSCLTHAGSDATGPPRYRICYFSPGSARKDKKRKRELGECLLAELPDDFELFVEQVDIVPEAQRLATSGRLVHSPVSARTDTRITANTSATEYASRQNGKDSAENVCSHQDQPGASENTAGQGGTSFTAGDRAQQGEETPTLTSGGGDTSSESLAKRCSCTICERPVKKGRTDQDEAEAPVSEPEDAISEEAASFGIAARSANHQKVNSISVEMPLPPQKPAGAHTPRSADKTGLSANARGILGDLGVVFEPPCNCWGWEGDGDSMGRRDDGIRRCIKADCGWEIFAGKCHGCGHEYGVHPDDLYNAMDERDPCPHCGWPVSDELKCTNEEECGWEFGPEDREAEEYPYKDIDTDEETGEMDDKIWGILIRGEHFEADEDDEELDEKHAATLEREKSSLVISPGGTRRHWLKTSDEDSHDDSSESSEGEETVETPEEGDTDSDETGDLTGNEAAQSPFVSRQAQQANNVLPDSNTIDLTGSSPIVPGRGTIAAEFERHLLPSDDILDSPTLLTRSPGETDEAFAKQHLLVWERELLQQAEAGQTPSVDLKKRTDILRNVLESSESPQKPARGDEGGPSRINGSSRSSSDDSESCSEDRITRNIEDTKVNTSDRESDCKDEGSSQRGESEVLSSVESGSADSDRCECTDCRSDSEEVSVPGRDTDDEAGSQQQSSESASDAGILPDSGAVISLPSPPYRSIAATGILLASASPAPSVDM